MLVSYNSFQMEMLKNTYPCAAVILERAWGSEKGKSIYVFGQKQTLEKTAAACSNSTLKFIFKKSGSQ